MSESGDAVDTNVVLPQVKAHNGTTTKAAPPDASTPERGLDEDLVGGPRPMGTVSHASPPLVSGSEEDIRHHERQLCATELLILAERHDDPAHGGSLILAAVAISRREVTG